MFAKIKEMETIGNFFQSIYDSYRDRIKSPFIGSFVISFLIFNWQVFAILFYSEWPIHCRIEWIEGHLYEEQSNFWYPVLIALFYILVLPYIHLFFDWILSMYSNKKLIKKNSARVSDLKTQKAEAKLLREIADEEAGTSEILNLNTTVKNLTDEINTLSIRHQKEVDRLKNSEKKSNEIVIDLQKEVDKANTDSQTLARMIDNIRAESEKRYLPSFIKNILDSLTIEEKVYYVQLCDYNIFGTRNNISHDTMAFQKFYQLALFEKNDINIKPNQLTERGQYVYHLLKNTI